ncbi:hypothetical protein EDC04DRAFT_410450 [Pisolithus marmoratus]|nr:hypothetical protein EDC04DRAFT_2060544 [Pisolithus marmoratus]KAI6044181.1 hypothetical protein EDC04DRAFT_410450 [Pisolithus marmoratus]
MDDPWANAWEQPLSDKPTSGRNTWALPSEPVHNQEADLGLPSWSLQDHTEWTSSAHADDPLWSSSEGEEAAWAPSTYEKIVLSQSSAVRRSPRLQSEPVLAVLPPSPEVGGATNTQLSVEHSQPPSTSRLPEGDVTVPDNDTTGGTVSTSTAPEADGEPDAWEDPTILAGPDDEWVSAWESATRQPEPEEIQRPDEWETAQQEKEKFNRAVPPELLAAILRRCEQISDVISPQSVTVETNTSNDDWRSGPSALQDITILLNELLPEDSSLLPVQLSSTATANALNEALKLTRHSTVSGGSPLAKLLASKGSADWQKSVATREDVVPDVTPIGWRILDKGEHRGTAEETKPKRATGGLLSFWSRRASTTPCPSDDNSETSTSRSSISNLVSASLSQPQDQRDASPSKRSSTIPAPAAGQETASEVLVTTTTSAPSVVSRFLNHFSRARSTNSQHASLALSADDLEYLSDIVPSADDENNAADVRGLSNMINSSLCPEKLPPPLPPPPKPVINPSPLITSNLRPHPQLDQSSSLVAPILPPPLTPQTNGPPAHSLSSVVPAKHSSSASSFVMPAASSILPPVPRLSTPQPFPRTQSPFTIPPPPKAPTSLSLPPLIPPPPTSPPQTPRPSATQRLPRPTSTITPSSSSPLWSDVVPLADNLPRDSGDSDKFSTFSSGSPYRHSHFPSDSASVRSPESDNSLDRLRSPRSSISCSLDDFDDFVSSPSQDNSGIKTPSPPPVPAKNTPPSYRRSGLPLKHSVRSSDHMRTQSLMDQANATKGTWPSPRVEGVQPPPIPPPPKPENLLDFGDTMSPSTPFFSPRPLIAESEANQRIMERSQLSTTSPLYSSPLATQVGGMHQSSLSPFQSAFTSSPLRVAAKPLQSVQQVTSKPMQTSGLSSQDLSFFEGL